MTIKYNDKIVVSTVPKHLNPSTFTLDFSSIKDFAMLDQAVEHGFGSRAAFAINVTEAPKNISVRISEKVSC
jgi:hypothetical protein